MKPNDTKGNLTHERLKYVINYDPTTGIFTWARKRTNRIKKGAVAGSMQGGYVTIYIDGHHYLAHRLAWFYYFGEWPSKFIDHANTIKTDNRIDNLREATHAENQWNISLLPRNKSGFKGVSWYKKHGRWKASYCKNNKPQHIGYYDTPEEASAAYLAVVKAERGEFHRD